MSAQTLCDLLNERPDLVHHPNLTFFKMFMSKFTVPESAPSNAHVLAPGAVRPVGAVPGASADPMAPPLATAGLDVIAPAPALLAVEDMSELDPNVAALPAATGIVAMEDGGDPEAVPSKGDRRRERKAASAREYRRREKLEHCTLELKISELREEIFALTGASPPTARARPHHPHLRAPRRRGDVPLLSRSPGFPPEMPFLSPPPPLGSRRAQRRGE